MRHYHILQRGDYIPQDILSKVAGRYGFGLVVDIRKIKGDQASWYCAKYLSKSGRCVGVRKVTKSKTWKILGDLESAFEVEDTFGYSLEKPVGLTDSQKESKILEEKLDVATGGVEKRLERSAWKWLNEQWDLDPPEGYPQQEAKEYKY